MLKKKLKGEKGDKAFKYSSPLQIITASLNKTEPESAYSGHFEGLVMLDREKVLYLAEQSASTPYQQQGPKT